MEKETTETGGVDPHKKEIGKLYWSGNTVVLCTADHGPERNRFSGVVVEYTSPFPPDEFHRLGHFSDSWTRHSAIFKEYSGAVKLDNKNWKEWKETGCNKG